MKFLLVCWYLPRRVLILLISIYQKTLSPDHSWLRHFFSNGCCRFRPTCSEFAKLALKKYGVIRAIPKIVWRILRCNPWNGGGVDEP